ncbi:MAG: hypothetical protein Q8N53_25300 [Longimicrobiales bacterium]|nr:hypothetical protein [Longimicrobiales bacterium]
MKEAFLANLPHNLDFWLLGILIGCVVAGIIGLLGGPVVAGALAVGCLIAVGVTLVGSAVVALGQAVWDCL